jgi:D-alanyl-D-alanine carboxypeptidase
MRTNCRGRLSALVILLLVLSTAHPAHAGPLLLFEPATSRVIYSEEPDRAWHPASVTKLMTAYLTFEAVQAGRLAWDDEVPLSEHARSQPATRIGLRGGIKLNVEQAIRGLILRSANDFATALAERVAGTEAAFVEIMNATARRLGMTRTVYRNPHGLPDQEQVTTARDLAILTAALLKDFPDRAEVFSTPTVRIHKGTFHSQNDLLRTLLGADGMKTGFTCASGYNVVASATRDGRRLVAIVLGAANRQRRSERAAELIEAGFAYLAGGDDGSRTITIAPEQPIKVRGRVVPSETMSEPRAFVPVALNRMTFAPADPVPAHDIARQVRSGKCRGYGGFAKPEPEPAVSDAETGEDAERIVTGSVMPPPAEPTTPTTTALPAPAPASIRVDRREAAIIRPAEAVLPSTKPTQTKMAVRTRAPRPKGKRPDVKRGASQGPQDRTRSATAAQSPAPRVEPGVGN